MPDKNEHLNYLHVADKVTALGVFTKAVAAGNALISIITGLLASVLILYSGYVLYDTFYTQNQAFSSGWDLLQYRPQIIDDGDIPLNDMGLTALAEINEDMVGWLTVFDTHIDYPVLQGPDDLYYASHDIYKKTSLTGAIYLSAGSSKDLSDNYSLIYGHHMDNGAMFGDIDLFADEDFFSSHREGIFITPDGAYDLDIFACVSTDAYENMVYTVGDRDIPAVVDFARENALQFREGVADGATKVVLLSTCASAETNGRLVLYAVMTLRDDTPDDPDDPDRPPKPEDPGDPDNPDNPDNPDGPDEPDNPEDIDDPDVPLGPPVNPPHTPDDTTTPPDTPGLSGPTDTTDPDDGEVIDDPETPLAHFFANFQPTGGMHGGRVWALVNLICLIATFYLFLPVAHIRAKYRRKKLMRKVNEAKEELRELQNLRKEQLEERERIRQVAMELRRQGAQAGMENTSAANLMSEVTVDEFAEAVEELYYKVKVFTRRF
ncbi:MAG: sortase, partial [Clostridia bacterium]|nr:sortase [Clostridia bacterium]